MMQLLAARQNSIAVLRVAVFLHVSNSALGISFTGIPSEQTCQNPTGWITNTLRA